MGLRSRSPTDISFELLDEINHKGKASKWDLEKIVGTVAQFERYVTNFLLKYEFVEEIREGRSTLYRKTFDGELFHKTLNKRNIILAYRRISGRRLRREVQINQHDLDWKYRLPRVV